MRRLLSGFARRKGQASSTTVGCDANSAYTTQHCLISHQGERPGSLVRVCILSSPHLGGRLSEDGRMVERLRSRARPAEELALLGEGRLSCVPATPEQGRRHAGRNSCDPHHLGEDWLSSGLSLRCSGSKRPSPRVRSGWFGFLLSVLPLARRRPRRPAERSPPAASQRDSLLRTGPDRAVSVKKFESECPLGPPTSQSNLRQAKKKEDDRSSINKRKS